MLLWSTLEGDKRVDSPLLSRPAPAEKKKKISFRLTPGRMSLKPTPTTVPLPFLFLLLFQQHTEVDLG